MYMKIRISKISLTLAVGAAAVLALAACGSSGAKATVSPGAQPSATTAAPDTTSGGTGTGAAIVDVSMTKLGNVLVDDKGMTLYTLTSNGKPVPCTGACAAAWPPLVLPASVSSPAGASGVTGLTAVMSANGSQVAENGSPLYRFKGDKAPGDTNGNGIANFGGVWNVVMSTGSASTGTSTPPAAPPAATTPTTASSGGYGY
jgi:predicted lipoprotein with Yx(FWY)xxD motif